MTQLIAPEAPTMGMPEFGPAATWANAAANPPSK